MPMQLDKAPHAAEAHFRSELIAAGAPGHALDEARAAGVPWATILTLLAQYGPKAWDVLKQLLAALKTPPPGP